MESHNKSNEEIGSIKSSEEEDDDSNSSDTDDGMEEDGPSLIRGGSDSRTLYTQDKFNLSGRYQCWNVALGLECPSGCYPQNTLDNYC